MYWDYLKICVILRIAYKFRFTWNLFSLSTSNGFTRRSSHPEKEVKTNLGQTSLLGLGLDKHTYKVSLTTKVA